NASGTDNCSPVTISHSDVSTQDADASKCEHYSYTITRTFSAKDVCGNHTECTQLITVQDVTAPGITCPQPVTVNCQDSTDISATGNASGTDNCSPVTISHSDVSTQDADASKCEHYSYTITRTFSAKDVCGNHTECTQLITVQDVTAPGITCPQPVTVNCQDSTDISATGNASGTDNCSPVTISHSDVSTQDADASKCEHYSYTITRTFSAKDVCGNHTECTQPITVQDVTAPGITCPQPVTVNCQDSTDISATGNASGTDNCSPVTISHSDVSTQDADASKCEHYSYTITR